MYLDVGVLALLAVRCSGVCRMVEARRSGGGGRGNMLFGESCCIRMVPSLVGILSSMDWYIRWSSSPRTNGVTNGAGGGWAELADGPSGQPVAQSEM